MQTCFLCKKNVEGTPGNPPYVCVDCLEKLIDGIPDDVKNTGTYLRLMAFGLNRIPPEPADYEN